MAIISTLHEVTRQRITPPFPKVSALALFGLGCFWGAERCFWRVGGVFSTAVGYTGGHKDNANYEAVCTGLTGHNEVVLVIFNPNIVSYQKLLKKFWQAHNPTQGMRQGNDKGTQYRSGIYTFNAEQNKLAHSSKRHYQHILSKSGFAKISTEILAVDEFYYAEEYHQQYLAKNPSGYCG